MAARTRTYCLDTWAVLRFLEGSSPAARRVRQVMKLGRPIMSWINLGEAAARIKATHPLAYGEAFAIATTAAHGAVLLTGDPEITRRSVGCRVEDLRR